MLLLGRILDAVDRMRDSQRKLLRATRVYLYTIERQVASRLKVRFPKSSFKHKSVQRHFHEVTLNLYFKCMRYYAGSLFCSIYF